MEEILRQAISILRATWKHRHLGMVVAWIVGAVAAGVILRIPNQFEASARIYVDTQSILRPLMSGLAVQPNIEQQIMMLSRTLISRPNLEKLVRMADLDLNVKNKAQQDALIDSLADTLKIQGVGRDNLYTLSARDPDPAKASASFKRLFPFSLNQVWATNGKIPIQRVNSLKNRFVTTRKNWRTQKIV